ncbi:MAG: hypothetical protein QG564_1590 [Campylobacterota bacterium]|nr:hypothetical protein [Campylobacterota bacterium]
MKDGKQKQCINFLVLTKPCVHYKQELWKQENKYECLMQWKNKDKT